MVDRGRGGLSAHDDEFVVGEQPAGPAGERKRERALGRNPSRPAMRASRAKSMSSNVRRIAPEARFLRRDQDQPAVGPQQGSYSCRSATT